MSQSFVHLHVRTEYSIIDSIAQIKPLCEEVKVQRSPALAITDISNLFGMVKFYKTALLKGIKPLIGAELWVEESNITFQKWVVLCQNQEGYRNLSKLISFGYQKGDRLQAPLIKKKWLQKFSTGLIAIMGSCFDMTAKKCQYSLSQLALKEWMTCFSNRLYLEIQRYEQNQKAEEKALFSLANELQCPVVATNEVIFLKKSDFDAHTAKVCIQEGTTLELFQNNAGYSPEQYLKSPVEMRKLFQDIPQVLDNSLEIAKRCSFHLTLDQPVLPIFPVPELMTEESFLEKASKEGLKNRLELKYKNKTYTVEEKSKITNEYESRLNQELSVINSMGFPGYFLIVADFIQWAKSRGIAVGPGRGSGAGSLVAYALAITDLDPIIYDLLFERFLNPERVSMPDFDIDFCMENRDKVIEYVAQRYGRANVSQIATFGTMAAKAVIRDVGRVLGHPYGFVDKIAKLIPFEIGMTLEKALLQEPSLQKRYEEEEEVKILITLAKKLEGITRNVGKHAGGVVIAPSALTDFAPLYCEKDSSQAVIQFDKDDVEAIGLIKFDFLGLRTLTIIDWAVRNVNQLLEQKGLPQIDIQLLPLEDEKTFTLLKSCATTAIFQLESKGMKELIKRLAPDQFEEIIALVALFRPGPLQSGMVDDFINRKHGRAKVEYPHAAIEPILKPTYGVILYQEQVMQIAQTLAGYTLGGADLLRRAMGKKKPEEMAKQRTIFTEGAIARGVDAKVATYIFDLMEKFAGYGFNKSHSAAYALVSYQTAWLKAHFPSAFMAAVLSADMVHTDKVVNFIDECRLNKITIIPPDINKSGYFFNVNEHNEIVYGLGAIKGVGENAITHILEQRQKGLFKNIYEFCKRIDSRKVNKRVLESLIKSGSFDCFGVERSAHMAMLDTAVKQAEQLSWNLMQGQSDLFNSEAPLSILQIKPWSNQERLQAEKDTLGMYFTGHPLDMVQEELTKMGVEVLDQNLIIKKERKILIAGLVVSLKSLQTKNGDRMAVIVFDDRHKRYEITFFPDVYQRFRELLLKDQLLIIDCQVTQDTFKGGLKVRAQTIYTLDTAREVFVKKIKIQIQEQQLTEQFVNDLKTCLSYQSPGSCPIWIEYQNNAVKLLIRLGEKWNIKPSKVFIEEISERILNASAIFEYNN